MAIPTMLIGVLPTYATIGLIAPIFLTFLRMLQGLSVGGELAGSYSFVVEHAPDEQKGYMGSWTLAGNFGGKVLATAAVGIVSFLLPIEQLHSWGWRIPFILGLGIAFGGYLLRKQVDETPVFKKMKKIKSPLKKVLKECKTQVLHAAATLVIHTVTIYLLFVYLPVYLTTVIGVPYSTSIFSNFIALLIVMFSIPVGGALSDRYGRKQVLLLGSIAITLLAYPAFYLMTTGSPLVIFSIHWLFALVFGLTHGPIPALFAAFFKPEMRYTALAVSYNLCVGIFGGLTPFIATWLISITGSPMSPTYWLITCGLISCVAVAALKEEREIQYAR